MVIDRGPFFAFKIKPDAVSYLMDQAPVLDGVQASEQYVSGR